METQLWPDAQAMQGRAAFLELLREHERDVRLAAQRLCFGNEDRAQDLAQDAFLRAYEACLNGRFHAGGNGRAWLLRILTNLAINDFHKRCRGPVGQDADVPNSYALPADVPGESLLARTLDEELETALATLPDALRQCVHLVDGEGLEYADAARALHIPIGTVRSRLSRARLKLHGLLHGYARDRRLV